MTTLPRLIKAIAHLAAGAALLILVPAFSGAQEGCSQLVWADEFEGSGAPDPSRWNFETGGGGWGNNELQFYTDSRNNSYVSNGTLKIHARKSNNTWTSARMVTSGKASWKEGRFEISAKLPTGRGTWPALWMMPQNGIYGGWPSSGEIDIMEHVGYDPGKVHGTVHTEAYNHKLGTQKGGSTTVSDFNSAFHVYSIEWTETNIKWFVDGKPYFTFVNENKTYKEWPFDHPFFLIFNIAIGGDWGGAQGIDPALTDAIMEIDYVRVYSNSLPRPVVQGPAYVAPGAEATFSVTHPLQAEYQWTFPPGVTVIAGAGSPAVTVIWGDQGGDVTAVVRNTCDAVASAPFAVALQSKPEGEFWQIPITGGATDSLLWSEVPGPENQVTLRVENNELSVTYNIQNPAANPHIVLNLPAVTDLTGHRKMTLQLKAMSGMAPSNVRIDLPDINGAVDLNDLFKIDNPTGDGQFREYLKTFAMTTSGGWQPSKISQVKIYFNYGILGRKGAGEFVLKNLAMQDPDFTDAHAIENHQELILYPNPVSGPLDIRSLRPFSVLRVLDMSGRVLLFREFPPEKSQRIDLESLSSGVYLIEVSGGKVWNEKRLILKH